MAGRPADKRAFVTGAGQGIGRAIVVAFAREGAAVIAASRTEAKLRDLQAHSPTIKAIALDVTDRPAVMQAIADAEPLDILVNCVTATPP